MYASAHVYLPDEAPEIAGGGGHWALNCSLLLLLEAKHNARQIAKKTTAPTLAPIIAPNEELRLD
jgi:hypothetical protein